MTVTLVFFLAALLVISVRGVYLSRNRRVEV